MAIKKSASAIVSILVVLIMVCLPVGTTGFIPNYITGSPVISGEASCSSNAARIRSASVSQALALQSIPFNKGMVYPTAAGHFDEIENIGITNLPGNESYPAMIVHGDDALVAYEYNDTLTNHVYLQYSENSGRTWSEGYYWFALENINITSPSLAIAPHGDAFGTFIAKDNDSGKLYEVNLPNIVFVETWGAIEIDWSSFGFSNFSNPDIVCYPDPRFPWVVGFIGSTTYEDEETGEGPCTDSPMFCFIDPDASDYRVITWFPAIQNCSNISMDIDYASSITVFGACEIQNGTNQDILVFWGDPDTWYYQGEAPLNNQTFGGPENLTHPDIFFHNNQIYIAMESDANGTIELILYNSSDGGRNWTIHSVTGNQPPVADFSTSADRLSVEFIDASTDDGMIVQWEWDFGDGNTSTEQHPRHTYAVQGTYTVNLTVTDDQGVNDTASRIVEINAMTPLAAFTYTPLMPSTNDTITFNDTSLPYTGRSIVNWTWDFNDGSLSYEQNTTHQYASNGTYTVKLMVRDNMTVDDSVEHIITVGLVANFTYEPLYPLVLDTIWFNDSSTDSTGRTVVNWTWTFDDGNTANSQNTTHQYTFPGTYRVNLTVRDNYNTTDTQVKLINVRSVARTPRYPLLFVNDTHVHCTYFDHSNIFLISSTDHGSTWQEVLQLNDKNNVVIEGYRNSCMGDMYHIAWTDNRHVDDDIYSARLATPPPLLYPDLQIKEGSVSLEQGYRILPTRYWVNFEVENIGTRSASSVPIHIFYSTDDGMTKRIPYPDGFFVSVAPSDDTSCKIPLFRFKIPEYLTAVRAFAGITHLTIIIDPNELSGDSNYDNNEAIFSVSFADIFPWLGRIPGLEDFLKNLRT